MVIDTIKEEFYNQIRKSADVSIFTSHSHISFKVRQAYKVNGKMYYKDTVFGPYSVCNSPMKFSGAEDETAIYIYIKDFSGAKITNVKYYPINKETDNCPLMSSKEWKSIKSIKYNSSKTEMNLNINTLGLIKKWFCQTFIAG